MPAVRYPIRLRPSLRRRRLGVSTWEWGVFAVVLLSIAYLLTMPLLHATRQTSSEGFVVPLWRLTDGSLTSDAKRVETDAAYPDKSRTYDAHISLNKSTGEPHPTLGAWFVDTSRHMSACVRVFTREGYEITDIEPFVPLTASVAANVEEPDIEQNLKVGVLRWSVPWPVGRFCNRLLITRAVCAVTAFFACMIGVIAFLVPHRAELRREFLHKGMCPRCQYSTRGIADTCPECGESLAS